MADNFSDNYLQVSETINSLYELTSRVDERVQLTMKKQDQMDNKMDTLLTLHSELGTKVRILEADRGNLTSFKDDLRKLEARVQTLEIAGANAGAKWKWLITVVGQFLVVIVASYILAKCGITPASLP